VPPIDGRHLGSQRLLHLHGGVTSAIWAAPGKWWALKRATAISSGEATGVSEVRPVGSARKKHAERQPDTARRSGSRVVKREVPQSPGHGCKPIGQGRGASLEEMLGANEARVLVSGGGKQESVSTHQGPASRHIARVAAEGGPSPKQSVETADADGGGSPLTRAICSGRSRAARKRSRSSAEVPSKIGVRANRCADTLPNRQRGGACLILSGVARRQRREAEMPRASSASPQDVADTTKGVPSRSSIFSLWGDGSSVRGDGGTILTLAVKLTSCVADAHGAEAGRRGRSRRAGARERHGASEGRSGFGEGSSSLPATGKRGGSASRAPRGAVAQPKNAQARFQFGDSAESERGCIGVESAQASVSE
jgi:hypothetical protein